MCFLSKRLDRTGPELEGCDRNFLMFIVSHKTRLTYNANTGDARRMIVHLGDKLNENRGELQG